MTLVCLFVSFFPECLDSCFVLPFNLFHSWRAQPGVISVLDSLFRKSEAGLISPSNSSTVSEDTLCGLIFCAGGMVGMRGETGRRPGCQWEDMQTLLHQMGSVLWFGILSSVLCHVHCIQLGKLFSSSGFFPPDYVKPWKLLQRSQAHCSFLFCISPSQPHFPDSCQRERGDTLRVLTPQMQVSGRGSRDCRLQHYSFGGVGLSQDWPVVGLLDLLQTRSLAFL